MEDEQEADMEEREDLKRSLRESLGLPPPTAAMRMHLAEETEQLVAEAEARGVLKERARVAAERCVWSEDSNGAWDTACGEAFVFTTHGPAENGIKFCPYCGNCLEARPVLHLEDPGLDEAGS